MNNTTSTRQFEIVVGTLRILVSKYCHISYLHLYLNIIILCIKHYKFIENIS